jgi:hypothetical protein
MLKRVLPACLIALGAFGQQPPAQRAATATASTRPPLFFREEWKHSGIPQHPISQESLSNPDLLLHTYGDPSKPDPGFGGIFENQRPQTPDDPAHTFSGTCRTPCALSLKHKTAYVDLSGFGHIRWMTMEQGFALLRPLLRLADGTWLIGDHAESYTGDWHIGEFQPSTIRWRRYDAEKVVVSGDGNWIDRPDLTRVDEIGFTDLMPGSGHNQGQWSDVAWIEVYGKRVPRE